MPHAPDRSVVNRTIGHPSVVNHIHNRVAMGSRLRRGHYYWFYDNGIRHAHYYDPYGIHWFGFYLGDAYFWARWQNGHLWWHDAGRSRWLVYRDGFWWWQSPDGTLVYVYRDGVYLRYDPVRGGYRTRPEEPSAPEEKPEEQTTFYSEDGSRMVEIFGERRESFLYDATGEEPAVLAFLAAETEEVQFSGGTEEAALQILVVTKGEDGVKAFHLFDADGVPYGAPTDQVNPESQFKDSEAFKGLEGAAAAL